MAWDIANYGISARLEGYLQDLGAIGFAEGRGAAYFSAILDNQIMRELALVADGELVCA